MSFTLELFASGGREKRLSFISCSIRYVVVDSSKGVGGTGFANVMIQCVFKSFWSQEDYQKTGKIFQSVSGILNEAGGTK